MNFVRFGYAPSKLAEIVIIPRVSLPSIGSTAYWLSLALRLTSAAARSSSSSRVE